MHKYSKAYYEKNKEGIKEKRRKYRGENKDKIREQRRHWYEKAKAKRALTKAEVLTHYGNGKLAWVQCGFNDIRALTLDHIQPIGQQERRITGINFYQMLRHRGYPVGYQTLCANCQMIKMFEGNEWKINS